MALKINGHSSSLNLTFRLWLYTIWPNFIKIGCLVLLKSCLRKKWHTDRQTHGQTDKSDHNNPSQNLWRGKKKKQLLIPVVNVLTSPRRKCNIMALQSLFPRIVFQWVLVLVHAGFLFCNWHSLNTNYYGTTFSGMPGSFNFSQINACVVGIRVLGPRFIVSSEGLGLHKMFPPRGFELGTSRMPSKCCTTRLQLPMMIIISDGVYLWNAPHIQLMLW